MFSKTKSEIRAKARRIAEDPEIDNRVKQKMIDNLTIGYLNADAIFKSDAW